MTGALDRTVCWKPIWNQNRKAVGLEHLVLKDRAANSVILAFNEDDKPFRLTYGLAWDHSWRLREADLVVIMDGFTQSLSLRTNGEGQRRYAGGKPFAELDGCIDIDIWPTPFTNSFPIRRAPMAVGERHEFRMAWISAPTLTVLAQPQAYRDWKTASTFLRTWMAAALGRISELTTMTSFSITPTYSSEFTRFDERPKLREPAFGRR